ncbi:CsiV family protein [Alteromonas facilis]|uniref:CsiV family protein n=1 Tax=Alteromonas facilis TaxID=2048004 RepID=UPI000C2932B8|nr:CsiV family protein [Alteromonas facilis]
MMLSRYTFWSALKSTLRASSLVLLSTMVTHQVSAQEQEWWFDIEVIVFERQHEMPVEEHFDPVETIPSNWDSDLISRALTPNVASLLPLLEACEVVEPLPSIESIIESYNAYVAAQEALAEAEREEALSTALNADSVDAVDALIELENSEDDLLTIPADETQLEGEELTDTSDSALEIDFLRDEVTSNTQLPEASDLAFEIEPYSTRFQAYIDTLPALEPVKLPTRINCILDSEYLDGSEGQLYAFDTTLPRKAQIPVNIDGVEWFRASEAHLLPNTLRELNDFARGVNRQKDHKVLLHTLWRQEVKFGRDVADSMRLIAGPDLYLPLYEKARADAQIEQNNMQDAIEAATDEIETVSADDENPDYLADTLAALSHQTLTPEQEKQQALFDQLPALLDAPVSSNIVAEILRSDEKSDDLLATYETPLWQIDGEFKVYLQYINRVPYLHIDNDLVYQRPTAYAENGLPTAFEAIELKQLRRVISQQVHYFDHPLFGIVVQIRRHQRPEPEVDALLTDTLSQ